MHEPKTWSFRSSYCSSWVRIMLLSFCRRLLQCGESKHFLGKLKQHYWGIICLVTLHYWVGVC
jgi:hypothetical protein